MRSAQLKGAYPKEEKKMIGILLTVLVAVLVYLILAALITPLVGIIGAILVLIAGIPSGGFGFGNRWGGNRNTV